MTPDHSAEVDAAYAACRAIAKREAKNFYYAFVVLPRHKSDAMCAVYAFMRKADDLADDESLSLDSRREAMAQWTAAWRTSRSVPTDDPVFLALNDTQQRFGISHDLLEQLVAGTTLDLAVAPEGIIERTVTGADGVTRTMQIYDNLAALQHYCYLVASVVGLVCIRIFGYTDRRAEQFAIDTGIAFQFTNILRDVKEDAERKRIYLPQDLLAEFEVTNADLLQLSAGRPMKTNEHAMLIGLSVQAWEYYEAAQALLPMVDADSRGALWVLVTIYSGLLKRIEERDADVFTERVRVPTGSKLLTLVRGAVMSVGKRR
jgi:phytoene synthase